MNLENLRIAIQKSGRLNRKSLELLKQCGIELEVRPNQLLCKAENYNIELILVRDDDIPEYVADGVCQVGLVGFNVFEEKALEGAHHRQSMKVIKRLGFGRCRLAIAGPRGLELTEASQLEGKRIATSYPNILGDYLLSENVTAQIVEISGAVEVAPKLGIADAICDLVSTGATLQSNDLKEVATIMESEAILIQGAMKLSKEQDRLLNMLLTRLDGVLKAQRSRYIMLNAPKKNLNEIMELIPGMENPTVVPLGTSGDKVAVHAVAPENIFWDTMERLKQAGASSILVVPIEKIIE